MEYIGGETLGDRLKPEALSLVAVQRIASEIAEALDTAHREHIVHRDLKPPNIMLTVGGHVKVLDFGFGQTSGNTGNRGQSIRNPSCPKKQTKSRPACAGTFRIDLSTLGSPMQARIFGHEHADPALDIVGRRHRWLDRARATGRYRLLARATSSGALMRLHRRLAVSRSL